MFCNLVGLVEAHLIFFFQICTDFFLLCFEVVMVSWECHVNPCSLQVPCQHSPGQAHCRYWNVDTGMWLCSSHEFGIWGAWFCTGQETMLEGCLPSCSLFPSCFHVPFIASELCLLPPLLLPFLDVLLSSFGDAEQLRFLLCFLFAT